MRIKMFWQSTSPEHLLTMAYILLASCLKPLQSISQLFINQSFIPPPPSQCSRHSTHRCCRSMNLMLMDIITAEYLFTFDFFFDSELFIPVPEWPQGRSTVGRRFLWGEAGSPSTCPHTFARLVVWCTAHPPVCFGLNKMFSCQS